MSYFLSFIFLNNIVLTNFLGSDILLLKNYDMKNDNKPFIIVLFFMMGLTSVLNYIMYHLILIKLSLDVYIIFVFSINILISYLIILFSYNFFFNKKGGKNTPYIFMNSLILGISILNINLDVSIMKYFIINMSSLLGFYIIFYILITLKNRIETLRFPKGITLEVIVLTTLGMLSMIFSGFSFS